MLCRVRAFFVALTVGALLLGNAAPAAASASADAFTREHEVPILIDAMLMRPMGLLMTGVGLVLSPLPMAIVALTRPKDIYKPFAELVVRPARFTFVDPLGQHY